jgi:hypothetical protein
MPALHFGHCIIASITLSKLISLGAGFPGKNAAGTSPQATRDSSKIPIANIVASQLKSVKQKSPACTNLGTDFQSVKQKSPACTNLGTDFQSVKQKSPACTNLGTDFQSVKYSPICRPG